MVVVVVFIIDGGTVREGGMC